MGRNQRRELLTLAALKWGEISEGRARELLGWSRKKIRDEQKRRVGTVDHGTLVGHDKLSDPRWLAAAILAYEADEPHIKLPDCIGSDYYPSIDPDSAERDLEQPHNGDCVQQPQACVRCFAGLARHKAEWIIEQAKAQSRHAEKRP
jgi:hypothetical protein